MKARTKQLVLAAALYFLSAAIVPSVSGATLESQSYAKFVFYMHLFDKVSSQEAEVVREIGLNPAQAQVLTDMARKFQTYLTEAGPRKLAGWQDMISQLLDELNARLDDQGRQLVRTYVEDQARPVTDAAEEACRRLRSVTSRSAS